MRPSISVLANSGEDACVLSSSRYKKQTWGESEHGASFTRSMWLTVMHAGMLV
jgi:hypothetical protein